MNKIFKNIVISCLSVTLLLSASACKNNKGDNEKEEQTSSGGFVPDGEIINGDIIMNIIDSEKYDKLVNKDLQTSIADARKKMVGISISNKNNQNIATGTGIAISYLPEKGYTYIATSHKFINQFINDAKTVSVYTYIEGSKPENAIPVGTDPESDVFVMKIKKKIDHTLEDDVVALSNKSSETTDENSENENISNILNDISNINPGFEIFSISNTFGEQTLLAATGIISACNFKIDMGENNFNNVFVTDVNALGSGLGSGIFSKQGGVLLGMVCNSGKYTSGTFALPSSTLISVCKEIIDHNFVNGRYKLGFVASDNRTSWGVTDSVIVTSVSTDGCMYAGGAGLKQGDIIEQVEKDGAFYPISTVANLEAVLISLDLKIGDELVFSIKRGGRKSQVTVKIIQYNYFDYVGIK